MCPRDMSFIESVCSRCLELHGPLWQNRYRANDLVVAMAIAAEERQDFRSVRAPTYIEAIRGRCGAFSHVYTVTKVTSGIWIDRGISSMMFQSFRYLLCHINPSSLPLLNFTPWFRGSFFLYNNFKTKSKAKRMLESCTKLYWVNQLWNNYMPRDIGLFLCALPTEWILDIMKRLSNWIIWVINYQCVGSTSTPVSNNFVSRP